MNSVPSTGFAEGDSTAVEDADQPWESAERLSGGDILDFLVLSPITGYQAPPIVWPGFLPEREHTP